jgi:hypothetical protein
MRRSILTLAALSLVAAAAGAQQAPCAYTDCALGIAPRWNGLDVVRGAAGTRVGSLSFFWPRDVRPSFAGSDSALRYAGRAMRVRRAGALLTDVGGVALAIGAASVARHGDVRGARAGLAIGGLALLGASVPLQFAADGELSRAVWWYNARLAR